MHAPRPNVSPSPQAARAPARVDCDHVSTSPEDRCGFRRTGRRTDEQLPVSPFVVASHPAPPGYANGPPLPCSGIRSRLLGTPNWATLPLCSVSITPLTSRRTGHHPGGCRASRISSSRPPISHVARPCYRPDLHRMHAAPATAQFPLARARGDFSGPKQEAPAYPSMQIVRGLAPSLIGMTSKPSRAFHG
jgi:hypothetical protein